MAGVAATTLAVGGMLVATAAPASAHTPDVNDSCSSLEVKLTQYHGADVTVTVDGKTEADETFESGWQRTFDLDGTAGHEWSVVVDAHDGSQFDWSDTGRTEPCPPTTPEPEVGEAQVAIYLYPKKDKDKPAAWENSGLQELVATTTIPWTKDSPLDDSYWYTTLPETSILDKIDVCTDWGIQQDLLSGGPDEYEVPQNIEFPDGTGHSGHLLDWTHQELEDLGITLPGGEVCGGTPETPTTPTPSTPPVTPDEIVVPVPPVAATVCGATSSDVELPAATASITYVSTEQGVLAIPAEHYAFGDDLGGYTRTDTGDVIFPIEKLVPSAEDCALVPGDIAAVCQGDTPYLQYGVSLPEGIEVDDDTPLTITFINPDGGKNYVAEDQPLEGSLLWPGATDTAPKQWPGWEQQDDGSYVETDGNYAWTRDGVQVLFEVNPEYSTVVDYPPASSQCANPVGVGGPDTEVVADDADVPPADAVGQADELPQTGATVGLFAGLAALLVAGGGLLFWLRRRIQH
ncbi:LPXTG cell wall anchor domain-containing protein [Isoptericola sp. NPDC055881]